MRLVFFGVLLSASAAAQPCPDPPRGSPLVELVGTSRAERVGDACAYVVQFEAAADEAFELFWKRLDSPAGDPALGSRADSASVASADGVYHEAMDVWPPQRVYRMPVAGSYALRVFVPAASRGAHVSVVRLQPNPDSTRKTLARDLPRAGTDGPVMMSAMASIEAGQAVPFRVAAWSRPDRVEVTGPDGAVPVQSRTRGRETETWVDATASGVYRFAVTFETTERLRVHFAAVELGAPWRVDARDTPE